MDALYYTSGILLPLTIIILTIGTVYLLAKPHVLNNSKHITKPFSRSKIFTIGLLAILISIFSFGTVMAATEPASVKQAREAEQAAAKRAEEDAEAKAKAATEENRKKREAEAKKPVVKTKSTTSPIPFESLEEPDPTLPQGQTRVAVEGVDGLKTITYKITYVQGKETNREKVKSEITHAPTTKIIKVGTYVAPPPPPALAPTPAPQAQTNVYYRNCSAARAAGAAPVYAGEPGYASHLDRDNDGIGCE